MSSTFHTTGPEADTRPDSQEFRPGIKARTLHVTNGDVTAELLEAAGVGGVILPWRDLLHEGPVPADLSDGQLRRIRAEYLAGLGGEGFDRTLQMLAHRDSTLATFRDYEEIVLWFEHDLYDQLQLIQILERFHGQDRGPTALSMICIDEFPGVFRFLGLGQLDPDQLRSLLPKRREVSERQLSLAASAWAAFRDPDPLAVENLLAGETSALEFLSAALRRHLEQLPSLRNGLGRTEQQAFDSLSFGPARAAKLFHHDQAREESPFLGDETFYAYLRRLAELPRPLVEIERGHASFADSMVALTDDGRQVLAGYVDAVALNGIDRWWGGVHQVGSTPRWRWDTDRSCLAGSS